MKLKSHHSKTFFYLLILGFTFWLLYSIFLYGNIVLAADLPPQIESQNLPTISNQINLQKENLIAKSYIIYDINNKKIVRSSNADTPLPLASLTKVITVGTLLDTAAKSSTTIREETKHKIKKALIQSSNDDADSLGEIYKYSFNRDLLADSNLLLSSLGLVDVKLTNLTGLDNEDGTASNTGTPESVAKIFAYVYENYREVFELTRFDSLETAQGTIKNTNTGTESTFGIMASKTGFTYEAGGNLGIVVSPEPGSAYVILVMQSTKDGRFTDVAKISKILPLILNSR